MEAIISLTEIHFHLLTPVTRPLLQADEEVFHSQLLTIHTLMTHMTEADTAQGDKGTLAREDFNKCLTDFFPSLSEAETAAMMKAVDLELEGSEVADIDYKSLFTEVGFRWVRNKNLYRHYHIYIIIVVVPTMSVVSQPRLQYK